MPLVASPLAAEAGQQAGQDDGARDARQAPDTTDVAAPKAAVTAPASKSPSRGPPATTAICTPDSRPRSASGTASWMIVLRNTAEMTSAQPAG